MANTLRFKRGLVSGIPTAALGEPLFTTDTFDLYIGNGTGNTRFQKYIASGTTSQLLRGDGSLLTMPIVLTSPSNGQVLKYNGTNWVNDSDAGITGSGASGQVAYFTGATTQSGSNNLFWDATNSRLGINNATPAQAFDLVGNALIKGSGSTSATTALIVENNAGTDMALFRNNRSLSFISDAGQLNIFSSADATNGILELDANSSASQTIFVQLTRGTVGLATSGNQTAVRINGGFSPTSGTGTWHNLHINPVINQTGGANGITRAIYIQPSLTSAADWRSVEMNNNSGWGIYQSGASAKNYFAGNTLIGSTSDNGQRFQVTGTSYFSDNIGIGVSNSAARLINIGKNISGSTIGFGIAQVNNVASDVTNSARIFYSEVGTVASAFTLSELNHYYAVQGTFGAGSAVTNQYGFRVFSNLTGASVNYGFYGDIASGTGRWNLYMNGTANNYINGSLAIGTTTFNDNLNPYKAVVFYTTSGSGGGGLMVTSNQAANGANAMVSAVQWGLSDGSVSKPSGLFFNYSNTTHGNRANNTVGNLISRTLVAAANLSITNNNGYISHVDLNSTSNDYVNYQAYLYVQRNSGTVNVNSYTSFRSMYQTAVANETITEVIDFRAAQPTLSTGALVTNRYGLLIDFNNTQVTNAWGVYQSQSTVNNYMNGALLIGTTTVGTFKLDVNGTMRVSGASTFTSAGASVKLVTTADSAIWNEIANSGRTFYLGLDNTAGSSFGVSGASVLYSDGSRPMVFFTNSAERMRIFSDGNVGIGTGSTNAGFRLDVNGTMRVSGATTITGSLGSVQVLASGAELYFTRNANNDLYANGGSSAAISIGAQSHVRFLTGTTLTEIGRFTTNAFQFSDGINIVLNATTGTKIGTATSQKLSFWNAAPIVQPTTAVASATRVGGAGNTITDTDTFDGYTMAQVVKALRNAGLLA